MKKQEIVKTERTKKELVSTIVPVVSALTIFLVSAIYIACKMLSNYRYDEKWKDYDECGLG